MNTMGIDDYKLAIATKGKAIFYKPFKENKLINQLLVLHINDSAKYNYGAIELAIPDTIITHKIMVDMQIAINRANKDVKEIGRDLLDYYGIGK